MPRRLSLPLALFGALLVAAPAAQASGQVTGFGHTGAEQTYTVPAGTTQVHIEAYGPRGFWTATNGGGIAEADLAVTPGQVLFVEVGGEGTDSVGGWNGGGAPTGLFTGGGGGASDVRTVSSGGNLLDPASLASRLLVASGGGGAGSDGMSTVFGGGGDAVGLGAAPGQPGTATAGGAGNGAGTAGTLGQGGDGGDGRGGGGGGGIYGGGGGGTTNGGGGGGGASGGFAPAYNITTRGNPGYGGAVSFTAGPATVIADGDVAFPNDQPVGTVVARQIRLKDVGLGPMEVGTPTISGDGAIDYFLGPTDCTGWLLTCRITVLFLPSAVGTRAATLSIPSSDPAGPLLVALPGGGAEPAAPEAPSPAVTNVTNVTYAAVAPATPATTTAPPAAAIAGAKMVLATCHTGVSLGKRALRCRIVQVPAGSTLPGPRSGTIMLANRKAVYGTGTARVTKDATQLLLTPTRKIGPGRYSTLTLVNGAKTKRIAVVIS